MKKLFSMISLLLLFSVLLSACAQGNNGNGGTQTTETTEGETEAPREIYGFWYAKEVQGAVEIKKENNAATFYSLAVGFYEYYQMQPCTYHLDGSVLTLYLEEESYEFVFEHGNDTLLLNDEIVYVRMDKAPIEHPIYEFPDYSKMDLSFLQLGDYKNMDFIEALLEDARLDIFLDHYNNSLEELPVINGRPAQKGDYLLIDYVGKINGSAFAGGSASDQYVYIAKNSGYIAGFAEGLIGHYAGETVDVPVTFPEEYQAEDLAGKDAVFSITIHEIYRVPLTEEQFKHYDVEYTTYEEWVYAHAKENAAAALEVNLKKTATYDEIPKELYAYFHQYYLDRYHYNAFYYGLDYETYLSYIGETNATILSKSKSYALSYIIPYLIAKEENLTWTQKDFDDQFEALVETVMSENEDFTEEQAKEYVNKNRLPYLHAELTYAIVMEWLTDLYFTPAT